MGYREHQDSDTVAFLGMAVVVVVFVLYLLKNKHSGTSTRHRDAGPETMTTTKMPLMSSANVLA